MLAPVCLPLIPGNGISARDVYSWMHVSGPVPCESHTDTSGVPYNLIFSWSSTRSKVSRRPLSAGCAASFRAACRRYDFGHSCQRCMLLNCNAKARCAAEACTVAAQWFCNVVFRRRVRNLQALFHLPQHHAPVVGHPCLSRLHWIGACCMQHACRSGGRRLFNHASAVYHTHLKPTAAGLRGGLASLQHCR